MIEFRKRNGLTLDSMARICDCSKVLIDMLESSEKEVTHPDIAERVRKAYKLTPEQAEGLLPENYRKSSPNYDPNKYREEMTVDECNSICHPARKL